MTEPPPAEKKPSNLPSMANRAPASNARSVVRHGRYITFQLPEVAIPRPLLAEILRLIDGLPPAPLPP